MNCSIEIRDARTADLDEVIDLDVAQTGVRKAAYWRDIFDRFVLAAGDTRFFLVAEHDGRVAGFIVGEVRSWEFGAPPSGWVFAIHVAATHRETGIGRNLLRSVCERFKQAGASTIRTMISHEDALILSFFRAEGLTAGPYIQLERDLA